MPVPPVHRRAAEEGRLRGSLRTGHRAPRSSCVPAICAPWTSARSLAQSTVGPLRGGELSSDHGEADGEELTAAAGQPEVHITRKHVRRPFCLHNALVADATPTGRLSVQAPTGPSIALIVVPLVRVVALVIPLTGKTQTGREVDVGALRLWGEITACVRESRVRGVVGVRVCADVHLLLTLER